MEQDQTGNNFDAILASWFLPGQIRKLGSSAFAGLEKAARRHARRQNYTLSLSLCTVLLVLIGLVSWAALA